MYTQNTHSIEEENKGRPEGALRACGDESGFLRKRMGQKIGRLEKISTYEGRVTSICGLAPKFC